MRNLLSIVVLCVPVFFSTLVYASNENQQCLSAFKEAKEICHTDFFGNDRAECMQAATNQKKACLAGDVAIEVQLTLEPAEVTVFSLAELDIPNDAETVATVSPGLDEGNPELDVSSGNLYIATPSDTGAV